MNSTTNAIITVMAPLLVAIATPLITRLFRKLGIDIADSLIEPILIRLIEIIAQVEKNASLSGSEKKAQVVAVAQSLLSPKEISTLTKKYGSLETAVQAAFERSSTALR